MRSLFYYDTPSKRILKIDEKYYAADHGLREAIVSGNERDMDQILENIVYIEMLKRGYSVKICRVGEKEIDFVCTKAKDCIYIQVCYLLASADTVKSEFGAYAAILDNYPKYVISMDKIDFSQNGIIHKNIFDFPLS